MLDFPHRVERLAGRRNRCIPSLATSSHHTPICVQNMQPIGCNPDWDVVVADVEGVLDDDIEELEWLGPVKLSVVTDTYKLKVALRRLRRSCQGTVTATIVEGRVADSRL